MSESAWDQSRFDDLLLQEVALTKRTYVEAVNSHTYFIARKALWLTKKADSTRIRSELEGPAKYTDGTLAEAILINRYNKQGGWPGSGAAFAADVARLIASRTRSVAFLKSGWIPAIQFIGAVVTNKGKAAPMDREARVYGQYKGSGYPAVMGDIMTAQITNSAGTETDSGTKALHKFGAPALDAAFYDEALNMQAYVEKKLAEQFAEANRNL